jgi:hypothetical protein
MIRNRAVRVRTLAAVAFGLLLAVVALRPGKISGQAAVSLSLAGQEDLSFWVNHNGLLQYEAEGEAGFGDVARVLLRRRANGEAIRQLRDRFTFRVQDLAALRGAELFQAEFANGVLSWKSAPAARFVAGAGRTFHIPVVVTNRDSVEIAIEAGYRNASMESAARKVAVAAGKSVGLLLRAVEPQPGAPADGKLTLRHGGGELSADVRFEVRPLVPLRVRVVDERGRPATARVYLTGSDGMAYAPRGSSARITAMSAEYFFHADDSFEIELPAGETLIEATRGPEYRLAAERVALTAGKPAEATLRLSRWTNQKEQGYWSSDVHIHANYTAPHHQTIEPRDVRLQVAGEDLNYGNLMVANSSGAFIHDRQYFEGRPHRLSSPETLIYWNEENRSSAYGHMCFLGLKQLVEPFYNGFRNTPFWEDYPANYPLAKQVYDQGGAVSYAHPGMVPAFDQASIKELPVDLALGQQTAMDVLSNNDENASTEMWYRLLNCGFRVPISAGTDSFTNVVDHYLAGGGRVYVQAGPRLDYTAWIDGFRKGRSFASNGPMVRLEVDGKAPGDEVRLAGAGMVAVKASLTTQVPVERVELLVNGRVAISESVGGRDSFEFTRKIPVERSSWMALRALGPRHRLIVNDTMAFGHTSAVYVSVAGRPVREAADIRFYREWVERLIARAETTGRFATPERRGEVVTLFRQALGWFQAAEAGK